jgi:hypothetical protein
MNKNGAEKMFLSVKQEAFLRGRHDFLKASRFLNNYSQKSLEIIKSIQEEFNSSITL